MIQIPHAYLGLVLGRHLTPKMLWSDLVGAIRSDGREATLSPLLDWAAAALTRQTAASASGLARRPVNHLGPTRADVVPALAVDATLQAFRWDVLREDIAALDPRRAMGPTDRFEAILQTVGQEQADYCAAQQAQQLLSTAPKTPSAEFPIATPKWMRYCGAVIDPDLPDLYGTWANCKKGERLQAFQDLAARAQEPDAATHLYPVVTKELYKLVLQGEWAPLPQQLQDLDKMLRITFAP